MLGLIDFPFSFALDTALLPWDVVYWALRKDLNSAKLAEIVAGTRPYPVHGPKTRFSIRWCFP